MARFDHLHPVEAASSTPSGVTTAWSAPVGVWGGVPVRVHVSLAVALVLGVGACLQTGSPTGWLALAVYLASLAVHELAHVAATARPRTYRSHPAADVVVLGPVGGLRVIGASSDPRERVFVAMAGPVASLTVVVASACCLASSEGVGVTDLLGSLLVDPYSAIAGGALQGREPVVVLAALLVAINWPLFLLNLAPASPFDGGVALRAWLGLWLGTRAARDTVCLVALLLAAGLLGAGGALVLAAAAPPAVGAALALLAVVIAYGARVDAVCGPALPDWPVVGDDDYLGASLHDLRRSEPGRLVAAELRHNERNAFDQEFEEPADDPADDRHEEDRLDDILAKVHAAGLGGLTANERAILDRASQRYQRRRRDRL